MSKVAFILHPADNVATLLGGAAAPDEPLALRGIAAGTLAPAEAVPDGHKFALAAIPAGAPILKYGVVVGRATAPIAIGAHVHIHNMDSLRGRGDLAAGAALA
ncbi:UxaA family hydrolase [Aquabacter spiritensis]|uniref:Altronate dehydratase small subunit n=1 Tax=Aquabacter spiritensis TaxID=933073 RepID=A0A4R3LMI0_9HYPH|nr:UxaA family hydrolase [Aquabacter spiritensis]TCT01504.1 altronate dehydratase small subunit [Aquabacter spiritensis]